MSKDAPTYAPKGNYQNNKTKIKFKKFKFKQKF